MLLKPAENAVHNRGGTPSRHLHGVAVFGKVRDYDRGSATPSHQGLNRKTQDETDGLEPVGRWSFERAQMPCDRCSGNGTNRCLERSRIMTS